MERWPEEPLQGVGVGLFLGFGKESSAAPPPGYNFTLRKSNRHLVERKETSGQDKEE